MLYKTAAASKQLHNMWATLRNLFVQLEIFNKCYKAQIQICVLTTFRVTGYNHKTSFLRGIFRDITQEPESR